jgi:hypothetical protein
MAAFVGAFVGCGVGKGHTSPAAVALDSEEPCTFVTLMAVALTPTRDAIRSFIGMQWSKVSNSAAVVHEPHIL